MAGWVPALTLSEQSSLMSRPTPIPSGHAILVAEDSSDQRALYVEILTSAGYRVLEASDGEMAVAIVRKERPRHVLMDVTMPGISGWNAVRTLKQDPDT